MNRSTIKKVAVIVAHPDDEILWAGGTLLSHPQWNVHVLSLCRASDSDRAPRFAQAQKKIGSTGSMGDLNDDASQYPLNEKELEAEIIELLPVGSYNLLITHHPNGEYTRHVRHEETAKAVIRLWNQGTIVADELWCFAYEDGKRAYYPKGLPTADIVFELPPQIWEQKYNLITNIYGFDTNSWEARTTPKTECFWQFKHRQVAMQWLSSLTES